MKLMSKAVVVTSGTFLNGVIHIGEKRFGGGRMAEKASTGITEQLVELGFESDSLKTGTPPELMEEAWITPKWKNRKEMRKLLGFLI